MSTKPDNFEATEADKQNIFYTLHNLIKAAKLRAIQ